MSYVASENIRRFRVMLEAPLSPERRRTIEALLAAELAAVEQEQRETPADPPYVRKAEP